MYFFFHIFGSYFLQGACVMSLNIRKASKVFKFFEMFRKLWMVNMETGIELFTNL